MSKYASRSKDSYFIKIPDSEKENGWYKCAYRENEEFSKEKIEKFRIEMNSEIFEHFRLSQNEKFSPLAKDIDVSDFLWLTEVDCDRLYKLRYFWTNGTLIVRKGIFSDISGIIDILHPANVEAYGAYSASHMEKITEQGMMIVLTDYENKVKGFKTLSTRRNSLGGKELLYIKNEARKQGAFRVIWEWTFEAAKAAGLKSVLTQCAEQNPVAQMYEHLGFNRKENTKQSTYRYKGKTYTNTTVMFEYPIVDSSQQTFF